MVYFGVLGTENEKKLANHVKKLQEAGFAPTPVDLRRIAYHFAEKCGIKHKFSKLNEIAGPDWLNAFLRRQGLSVRKAQGVSLTHVQGMCWSEVNHYFHLLHRILTENGLINKPSMIYNVDVWPPV